jgi:hypothetical protein
MFCKSLAGVSRNVEGVLHPLASPLLQACFQLHSLCLHCVVSCTTEVSHVSEIKNHVKGRTVSKHRQWI